MPPVVSRTVKAPGRSDPRTPVDRVPQRAAAAVLADWREVEAAIRSLLATAEKGRGHVAELAALHARARRLRVEYADIIRQPTPSPKPGPGGR